DVLRGGSGNDTLGGNFGDDRLFGEGGDDRMIGGAGADTLTGGVGKDVFVFSAGSGADVVTDFDGARDRVDLSAYHFTSLALARAAFTDTADGLQFQVGADSLVMTGFTLAALAEANLII
ncbi:MAG: hypothetical protein ABI832_16910, partial [bacterium]